MGIDLLVVEDERWEREGLVSLIDPARFGIDRVLTAPDGIEGLRLIRQARPALVITDIRMPGLGGLEMLERAEESLSGSVCIILSGYNEFAYAQKALRIGAADFLVKPVNEGELIRALERAVKTLKTLPGAQVRGAQPDLEQLLEAKAEPPALAALLGMEDLSGLRAAALAGVRAGAELPPLSCARDGATLCLLRAQDRLPESGFAAAGVAAVEGANLADAFDRARMALDNARFHGAVSPLVYGGPGPRACSPRLLLERAVLAQALAALDEERVLCALRAVRARMAGDLRLGREQALREIAALAGEAAPGLETELALCGTLEAMLDLTQARLLEGVRAAWRRLSEPERYVVRRVIVLVDEHYRNADLNLQALAAQVFLSPNYVGQLFKRSAGVAFSDYLCRHRLMVAARLLWEEGMRVSAVAERVGIPNVSYFCVQFRNAYGLTPSRFKKRQ